MYILSINLSLGLCDESSTQLQKFQLYTEANKCDEIPGFILTRFIFDVHTVTRTATIWDGVWIDNWIYWTQLNYTTRDYTLQFTVRHTHTNLLSSGVLVHSLLNYTTLLAGNWKASVLSSRGFARASRPLFKFWSLGDVRKLTNSRFRLAYLNRAALLCLNTPIRFVSWPCIVCCRVPNPDMWVPYAGLSSVANKPTPILGCRLVHYQGQNTIKPELYGNFQMFVILLVHYLCPGQCNVIFFINSNLALSEIREPKIINK
jgi:hypothetical protein